MLTQFYRTRMLIIMLIGLLFIQACAPVQQGLRVVQDGLPPISDGFVGMVHQRTFLQILTNCVKGGCAGTTILKSPGGNYIFGGPLGQTGTYIWGGITADAKNLFDACGYMEGGCGNLTTAKDFSDSVKWFTSRGWIKVGPGALPFSIRMYAVMCNSATYLTLMGGTLSSPLIVPLEPLLHSPVIPDQFEGGDT
jgi:hypothetical protein